METYGRKRGPPVQVLARREVSSQRRHAVSADVRSTRRSYAGLAPTLPPMSGLMVHTARRRTADFDNVRVSHEPCGCTNVFMLALTWRPLQGEYTSPTARTRYSQPQPPSFVMPVPFPMPPAGFPMMYYPHQLPYGYQVPSYPPVVPVDPRLASTVVPPIAASAVWGEGDHRSQQRLSVPQITKQFREDCRPMCSECGAVVARMRCLSCADAFCEVAVAVLCVVGLQFA
jgi:hypothetical protein